MGGGERAIRSARTAAQQHYRECVEQYQVRAAQLFGSRTPNTAPRQDVRAETWRFGNSTDSIAAPTAINDCDIVMISMCVCLRVLVNLNCHCSAVLSRKK